MISVLTSSLATSKARRDSGRITRQPLLVPLCVWAALAMAAVAATPAMAYTPIDLEMFNMPDGPLWGQTPGFIYTSPAFPTWGLDGNLYEPDPNPAGSEISVVNGSLRVSSNTSDLTTTSRWIRYQLFVPNPQIPMFQFWAKRGGYTGSDVTSWYLSCGMAAIGPPEAVQIIDDRSFGRFTGNGNSVTCWGPTFDENIVTKPLTDQWQCFTAMGDDTSAYTYYFLGNEMIGYAPCWAHSNPKVYWVTVKSYPSSSGSSYVYLDNVSYGYALTRDEQPIVVTESPDDTTAPNPVTGFAAVGFNGQVALSWSNPASPDFHASMIRFKTTGYPTSVTDGTLLVDQPGSMTNGSLGLYNPGTAGGYVHSGLTNGVTYYYSAFTHDLVPNYSAKVDISGTPSSGECWNESFMYPNGPLAGNGAWTGACPAVTVVNQTVRIVGDGESCNCAANVTYAGKNGIILVSAQVKAGTGSTNMWDFWINDAAGRNLARWYGSGTSARPRIGATSIALDPVTLTGTWAWDTLEVEIDTNRNYSYFYFNGTLLGGLNHSSTGAGNTVGSVWLGRQNTTAPGEYVWFNNIFMGGAGPAYAPPDLDKDGDVDQSDFGHFQACLSGWGVVQNDPACANALLDGDADVDQDDLDILQGCMSGASVPADSNCAN